MPITKDLKQALEFTEEDYEDDDDSLRDCCLEEELEEMLNGNREHSDLEKTLAQKTIRRSVVREKFNWSCQFGKGVLNESKSLEGVNKLFMDSRGAAQAISSIRG